MDSQGKFVDVGEAEVNVGTKDACTTSGTKVSTGTACVIKIQASVGEKGAWGEDVSGKKGGKGTGTREGCGSEALLHVVKIKEEELASSASGEVGETKAIRDTAEGVGGEEGLNFGRVW